MNRITPLILAVALFMEMMDSTVIATSLPAIAADIGTEPIALKLAMTAYLVALAIFIPVSGWMADRFGARTVFRWAILVFMLGSLGCAVSGSLVEFVGARFFQGMGGSMMTPLARLVLVRATPREQLVPAMAWLTVPALMGPVVGPPVGGFLTTFFSWHWIFLINIPIGTLGIVLASVFLPRMPPRDVQPIDWPGFFLVGTAFAGILFGLSVVSLPALPPLIGVAATLIGAAALAGYVRHARRRAHPLLDLRIFEDTMFRTAVIGGVLFRVGMGATPFLLPLMLQLGFGMTPFETGLIMLFGAAAAIFAKFFAARLFATFGFRTLLMTAALLSAGFLASKGLFVAATPAWVMIAVMLAAGLVRSTFFTGINAMYFAEIPEEYASQATAITSVATHLSFALGVALAGGVLEVLTLGRGASVGVPEFHAAFFIVAGVSAFAVVPFTFLARDAGAHVSGHARRSATRERDTAPLGGE